MTYIFSHTVKLKNGYLIIYQYIIIDERVKEAV